MRISWTYTSINRFSLFSSPFYSSRSFNYTYCYSISLQILPISPYLHPQLYFYTLLLIIYIYCSRYAYVTDWCQYSPLSTIFPNKFFPLRIFLVEQFHRWFLNWYWHSYMAWFAPLAIADKSPGFSRTKRLCFLLRVLWTEESIRATPGDIGDRLLGSPALAIPLKWNWKGR